ncbi:MAG: hypothetical protein H6Q85_2091 [candidate division NC10 bacterium]|nr:hypothetical protein [candidate division NC10 bacterium]
MTHILPDSSALDEALQAASRGWPVFPVVFAVGAGGKVTKRPAIRAAHDPGHQCRGACGQLGHGHHDATTDPDVIRRWDRVYRPGGWGTSLGPAGIVVVDLDRAKGSRPDKVLPDQGDTPTPAGIADGDDVLCWAAELDGADWPPDTYTVATQGRGTHVYLSAPPGLVVTSGAGLASALGWCVDVRAHGGWVVTPGSRCPSGSWDVASASPVAPLPGWLLVRLVRAGRVPALAPPRPAPPVVRVPTTSTTGPRRAYMESVLRGELDAVANAIEGTRNDTLNRAAFNIGTLLDVAGLDVRTTANALLAAGLHCGLTEAEAKAAIRSGFAAGSRQPRRLAGGAA